MTYLINLLGFFSPLSISATQITYGVIAVFFLYNFKERKQLLSNVYFKLFLLLFAVMLVTSLAGLNPAKSLKDLKQSTLILTFLLSYYLMDKRTFKTFVIFLMAGALISIIYGKIVYDHPRISGAFKSPVSFGNLLVFVILSGLYSLLFLENSKRQNIILVFFTAVLTVSLFLTGTRGAIIAAAVALPALVSYKILVDRNKRNILIFVTFIVGFFLIGGLVIYFSPVVRFTFAEALFKWHVPTTSFGWRFILWKESWQVFLEHPLLGIGMGNIKPIFVENITAQYGRLLSHFQSMAHCHNMYLQMLVDYGLIGTAAVCSIFAKLAYDHFKMWRKKSTAGFAGLVLVLALCIEGISESVMFDSEITMLFWFLGGAFIKIAPETRTSYKQTA